MSKYLLAAYSTDEARVPMTDEEIKRGFAIVQAIEGEQRYRVASIADLIAMKRATGRPQDAGHIHLLRAVWETSTEADGQ